MREIKFRAWQNKQKLMILPEDLNLNGFCGIITGSDTSELDFMQFIGLEDKNGKEIYEGDIICCRDGIYAIEYIERFAKFVMSRGDSIQDADMCMRSIEVIGNIYENPKLMENQNETKK